MNKIFILIVFNLLLTFTFSLLTLSYSSFSNHFIYPTSYVTISSEYGYRTLYDVSNFHNGIDFLAPEGSEILASESGKIVYASFMADGFGNTIIIEHENNLKTLYCHVSEYFIVGVGEYVTKGQVIGNVGPRYLSTGIQNGNTTGPHLHFSVYKNNSTINPFEVLNK